MIESAAEYPVVTVLGPRQSGKTTLVRMTYPDKKYISMEDPDVRMAAETDPRGFLNDISFIINFSPFEGQIINFTRTGIINNSTFGLKLWLEGSGFCYV